ncbi:MAG: metallophosphoesterase [Planctomycetota bacterium]
MDDLAKKSLHTQNTFKKATEANFADKYRNGNLIELPREGDLIIAGDIHGNRENYDMIVASAKLKENPKRHLIIQEVVHRYELGADTSYDILLDLAKLKIQFPDQLHIILGNHELAEYQKKEIYKGGICLNILFDSIMQKHYKEFKDAVRKEVDGFIRSIPLASRTPFKTFMVHSTPNREYMGAVDYSLFLNNYKEKDIEEFGKVDRILWGRCYDQDLADEFCKKVDAEVLICGHRACSTGFTVPNKTHIILDCKDPFACVIYMKLDRHYTHEELVKLIKPLRPKIRDQIKSQQKKQPKPQTNPS